MYIMMAERVVTIVQRTDDQYTFTWIQNGDYQTKTYTATLPETVNDQKSLCLGRL